MMYRWLADITVTIHFGFLLFVVLGGVVRRRYRWLTVPHLLSVAWAVYVEATPGLICPLTPLENYFATGAGRAGYEGSFIEHYLAPIIYPDELTPTLQVGLAGLVLGINLIVYAWSPVRRRFRAESTTARHSPKPDTDFRPRTHEHHVTAQWSRAMKLNPYLAFDGRCREAFEFYEKALGGTISFIQTIGESPMASNMPSEAHGRVMHVTLQIGDQVLQGADAPPGQFTKPAGFCVALQFDDVADGERVFAALGHNGKVPAPFQPTFWAKGFGMLIDQFGTPWIVNAGQLTS